MVTLGGSAIAYWVALGLGSVMQIYRFLTGEDDSAFCHKVTKALVEGWILHGSPQYAYDAVSKKMRCGQAVVRTVSDQPYDPDKKLVDYR